MMHFLFTDPQTGDGQAFFDLMRDFVRRYNGSTASTEQFFAMANEHVRETPLARKFGYTSLDWFFRQWVTKTYLPTYELSYHIEQTPDGGTFLKGEISQLGFPESDTWIMPLPLVISFPGHGIARATVLAKGSHTLFQK
jgi:aminopeptidase N